MAHSQRRSIDSKLLRKKESEGESGEPLQRKKATQKLIGTARNSLRSREDSKSCEEVRDGRWEMGRDGTRWGDMGRDGMRCDEMG